MDKTKISQQSISLESKGHTSRELEYIAKEIKAGRVTNIRMVIGYDYRLAFVINAFHVLSQYSGIEFETDDDAGTDIILRSEDGKHRFTLVYALDLSDLKPTDEHLAISFTSEASLELPDIEIINQKYKGLYSFLHRA